MRLSLCMIVRDEAEMLPAFLDGVRGLWDELLVVDTGSSDTTVEILEGEGATVLTRPWDDDFAAARNHGLERARGDYVLVLDADERVSPALAREIRGALEDPRCGAASLLVVDELPHGHSRSSRLVRIFRNDRAIRYRHVIHEDVASEVAAFLARTHLARADLVAPLAHLGYERARAQKKNKKERDVRLLRAALARDPNDLYARYKLLEQARFWGDHELWRAAAQETWAALEGETHLALRPAHFAGELAVLVSEGLHGRDEARALECLEWFGSRLTPSAAYELRRGELRERLGDRAGARRAFQACLSMNGTDNAQLATVRPRMGLARLALAEGDLLRAAGEAERALGLVPLDPEALLLLATLRAAQGGKAELARFGTERRALSGDRPEIAKALREAERLVGGHAREC